jgi:WD40 repeat protein
MIAASNRASFSCFEGSEASLFRTAIALLQKRIPELPPFYSLGNLDATRGDFSRPVFSVNPFQMAPGLTADNAGLAFSPDGRKLAVAARSEARLWDLDTGNSTSWKLPEEASSDGRYLVAMGDPERPGEGRLIKVFQSDSGNEVLSLPGVGFCLDATGSLMQ